MRTLLAFAVVAALFGGAAAAQGNQDKLTLGLKWLPQAQFAGYYVALERGFYRAENLEVSIKPGGPDPDPPEMLRAGLADVVVDWMPSALAAREKGLAMINIAQMFKRSGLWLTCRKDARIRQPADLKGHTVGVWYGGNEYPFLAWMAKLGLGPSDVKTVKQGFDVELLRSGQADCISTMSYNEYGRVLDAGLSPKALTVFKYQDRGVATLEDGLYVLEQQVADAAMRDRLARFLRASIKGWQSAVENQRAAVSVVMREIGKSPAADAKSDARHQARMLAEIARLVDKNRLGRLDPKDYERTVATLLAGESDPVITRAPAGAWTHAIWQAAQPN